MSVGYPSNLRLFTNVSCNSNERKSRRFQAGIISVTPFSAYFSSTGDPRPFVSLLFVGLALTLHPVYTKDIKVDCPNAVLPGL